MAVFVLDKQHKPLLSRKKSSDDDFNLQTADGVIQGISSKDLRHLGLISPAPLANFNTLKKERRFLSALKGWVFALSLR